MSKDTHDKEFYDALEALAAYSAIPIDSLIEKIEQGILKAVKKEYIDCDEDRFIVEMDRNTNVMKVSLLRTVVPDEPIDLNEINIEDAREIDPNCQLDDRVPYALDPKKFKRGAVSYAKQSLHHDVKEYEKEKILADYRDHLDDIMTGEVVRINTNESIVLKLGPNELTLFKSDQLPGDVYNIGDMVCVYLSEIVDKKIPGKKPPKVPIRISRTNREFLRRLFEREVPEIFNGEVVIKGIVREPGNRSKVAVASVNPDVDPIGACIGPHSRRIENVLGELSGERVDLIPYDEDKVKFVTSALSPAKVTKVIFSEEDDHSCTVYVPENQLSLAIGKDGINAKLAARLTSCRLDIKPSNGADDGQGDQS